MEKGYLIKSLIDRIKESIDVNFSELYSLKDQVESFDVKQNINDNGTLDEINFKMECISNLIDSYNKKIDVLRQTNIGKHQIVEIGSVVKVKKGKQEDYYFITPNSGGELLSVDSLKITTITPNAPLAIEMIGKKAGKYFNFKGRYKIEEIV